MKIGIYVNTDARMSKDMLDALTRYEFQCVFTSKKTTTTDEVVDFLKTEYNQDLADKFSPGFMAPAP